MLLAVDVGNTHTVAGLFAGARASEHGDADGGLVADWRFRTQPDATADELAVTFTGLLALAGRGRGDVASLVVSSVVPAQTEGYRRLAQRYLGGPALVVGPGTRTGMPIRSDNPHEVGADRIVNGIAAYERYRGPCIVVDMGTATTYDAISADGAYVGGAIAPGLGISIDALVAHAARLASVDLVVPARAIGTNTVTSMQSGAMFGAIAQVEGMIARFRAELAHDGPVPAIATGGQATAIAAHVDGLDDFDPLLTLRGLQLVASRR